MNLLICLSKIFSIIISGGLVVSGWKRFWHVSKLYRLYLWFKSAEYASEFCSTPTPLSTEYGGKACVVMTIGQLFQHKFSNKKSHLRRGGRADQKIMKHVIEV